MGGFQWDAPSAASQVPPSLRPRAWEHRVCSMRPEVLALALASLLAAAHAKAAGEGNPVKLCGRDFVRAIVFTCGGSRWKRHVADYAFLLESENPLPFSRESTAYADPPGHGNPQLAIGSDAIPSAESEAEGGLQGAGKMSVLEKREAAKLLTTSCCSVGCSERDISSLC
ncbi:insulin-like peptide INSL5 [Apteryx mantelli]|uniref:Insulin-like peptide INSL5 n=1 Tax=Apteryx mantelli TaxID=2696672 RepID=A0ABM4EXP9_9AVES